MDSFADCWAFTLGVEKGFFDDPAGGPTMYGVTEHVARAWGYAGDMREMPLAIAQDIARHEYYDKYHCEQLPPGIALLVFDTAYNGGKPVRWLQEAIGVTADGLIGAGTIAAARAADPARTAALFCAARLQYLQSLRNFHENAGGWVLRIAALLERAAA